MPDVDGSFTDPDGRSKFFVRRREDESDEAFAVRAMDILFIMSDLLPLERVVTSEAHDFEKLPRSRWLDARHSTDPKIRLRVTELPSAGGGSVGHLSWNTTTNKCSTGGLTDRTAASFSRGQDKAASRSGHRRCGDLPTRSGAWATSTRPLSHAAG